MTKARPNKHNLDLQIALAALEGRKLERATPEPDENYSVLHLMGVSKKAKRTAEPPPPVPLHKIAERRRQL